MTSYRKARTIDLPPMSGWQPKSPITPLRLVGAFALVAVGFILGRVL